MLTIQNGGMLTTGGLVVGDNSTGTLVIQSGGTVVSTVFSVTIGQSTGQGTVSVSGANSTLTGPSIGVGTSPGTTGTLTVSNGAVVTGTNGTVVGGPTSAPPGTIPGIGTVNLNSGGILQTLGLNVGLLGTGHGNFDGGTLRALPLPPGVTPPSFFIGGFTKPGDSLNLGPTGLTIDSNGLTVATDSSAFSGTGGLTKAGSGTLTLNGANTYTGPTVVNTGTLQAGIANAFAPGSAHTIASGATLDLNNLNQTIGSLAGAGNVTLGSGTLTAGATIPARSSPA
jgi:autotransporter-associated beta strand protein/T5SS/PEP-CTERM-associated repeat protein